MVGYRISNLINYIKRTLNVANLNFRIYQAVGLTKNMDSSVKREHNQIDDGESSSQQPIAKFPKIDDNSNSRFSNMTHGKGKLIPKRVFDKLTADDVHLIENIKTSCSDLEKIQAAIKLRRKNSLSIRLPEDDNDSTYFIENGLRKVYPYPYLYQTYAKRRWLGRKLKDVLKEEFRDITDEQLKLRFDSKFILVNGDPVQVDYVIKDNDFVANRNHRHELPVLATPIKIIFEDKDMLVIDKPPSMPIHPCGRYRHNSVVNILKKEYKFENVKVVHRLDRLVSGVLITAKNTGRANLLENMIKNRDVQKEYVCRVAGEFPLGESADDGYVTVDKPLETVAGKIGITVVHPEGKPSLTKFKRLNYNGKTSAVLCKPLTGRMHQIRVHLQYLGHPIVNDSLYNSDAFGPERGKGGKFGKTLKQLSNDVISLHRASSWLISDDNDLIDLSEPQEEKGSSKNLPEPASEVAKFLSLEERNETMAALEHYFTNESCKDLEQKWKFDPKKLVEDPACRDCNSKFHDPPMRRLFLYLHAFRYAGTGWCYESEMPNWARDTWSH